MRTLIHFLSSFLAGITAACGSMLTMRLIERKRQKTVKWRKYENSLTDQGPRLSDSLPKRILHLAWRALSTRLRAVVSESWQKAVEGKLNKAGHPFNLTAVDYLMLKFFLTGLFVLIALTLALATGGGQRFVVLGIMNGVLLPNLLDFWIGQQAKRREREISQQLPSVMDLLVVSMEAGLSFDAGLDRVRSRLRRAAGEELSRVAQEVNMGRPRSEAFYAMAERTGVTELRTLALALSQGEETGTSLGGILRTQANMLRVRRQQRAREAAMKIPIKMLFPMLFFIFPAMFLVLLGPAAMRLASVFMKR